MVVLTWRAVWRAVWQAACFEQIKWGHFYLCRNYRVIQVGLHIRQWNYSLPWWHVYFRNLWRHALWRNNRNNLRVVIYTHVAVCYRVSLTPRYFPLPCTHILTFVFEEFTLLFSLQAREHVANACAILVLSGPTWVIGFIINLDTSTDGLTRRILAYVFVLFNAFQVNIF